MPTAAQDYTGTLTFSANEAVTQTATISAKGKVFLDPYISQVALLMHFDGANGSQAFTDAKGHAVTVTGHPTISTAQSRFGGASAYFDGSSYLTAETGSAVGDDFTIEFWMLYQTGNINAGAGVFSSRFGYSFSGIDFFDNGDLKPYNYNLMLVRGAGYAPDNWHHVAISRKSGTVYLFMDGVLQGTSNYTVYSYSHKMLIGRAYDTTVPLYFKGYIDELRVTPGVARYTSNFNVPTAPFPEQ